MASDTQANAQRSHFAKPETVMQNKNSLLLLSDTNIKLYFELELIIYFILSLIIFIFAEN